jgi:dihydroxyacetone kinase-like protein
MSELTSDQMIKWLERFAALLAENKDHLTQLDSAIGDADHGANMDRGFKAVLGKKTEFQGKDVATVFKTVAMTLISTVGGASGPPSSCRQHRSQQGNHQSQPRSLARSWKKG